MTLPPVPETIGRFKIEARLGSGGMGEVYKAQDPTLRRTVAIKTVRPDIDNPVYLERLYREAQAIARLQHPNIVTVFEAGEMNGLVYIAMEYLKGENLAVALERGELTFEAKVKILMQILEALQYAHSEGVIHRDVKPANVHRLPDGVIKLLDFGLARITRAESLTQTGAVMGTPYYASPEQLKGETVDGRTDVYSAGVVAYELFTARRAFEGENLSTVIAKVLYTPPPPMETSWANTFPEIERIVSRAMAKSAADRYATAEDMRNALAAFLSTSRDGLASLQAEQTMYAKKAVQEAKTLISSGAITQAHDLLAETLRSHPEAAAARTLLKETMAGGVMPPKPPAAAPPSAPPPFDDPTIVRPRSATPPPPVPVDDPTIVRPRSAAPPPPPVQSTPAPPPFQSPLLPPPPIRPPQTPGEAGAGERTASSSLGIVWALAAAVVILAAVGGWMIYQRRTIVPVVPPSVAVAPPAAAPATPNSDTPAPPPAAAALDAPASAAPQSTPQTKEPGVTTAKLNPKPASTPAAIEPAAASKPAPAAPAPVAENTSAKKLFAESASRNAGLRYGIVQQTKDGAEIEVDPETVFHSGDRVRFLFEPNIDGFLYVVEEGSSGKWNTLFPSPQINGGVNTVRRGQKYAIPSQGWFKFDNNAGTEKAFVFLSKEPMSSLPGFKDPVTKTETVEPSVVDDLKRSIKSRDLVFEKDRQADPAAPGAKRQSTFVVNRDELGKSVSATIQLVHQ